MLKFLSKLGKEGVGGATGWVGAEHAKHSALWEWISHVTAFKFLGVYQTNVTRDGRKASLWLHPKVNEIHIHVCAWCVCLTLVCLREAKPGRRTFNAWADRAVGILVETGNSVDYSLAIRLLSVQWLSLSHHEIAWLSARLESVLGSNPPANPPDPRAAATATNRPATHSPLHVTLPFLFPTPRSSCGSPQVSEAA